MKALKVFTVLTSIMLAVNFGSAQTKVSIKKSEFQTAKEGFNDAWRTLKEGNEIYDEGKGRYIDAREKYLFAHTYNPNIAALNYLLGVCYVYSDNQANAVTYLEKAIELDSAVTPDVELYLARAYHFDHQFDKAKALYESYLQKIGIKKAKKLDFDIELAINQCENAQELLDNPVEYEVKNMGPVINSVEADYYPVLNKSGEFMYFTSRRLSKFNDERNELNQKFYEDIYSSRFENGAWTIADLEGKQLNTEYNNTVVGMSNDGNRIFMYDGRKNGGDIVYADYKNGKWSSTKSLNGVNSSGKESSLTQSPTGDTLYFVSDRKNKLFGGSNIYMTTRKKAGKDVWNRPVVLDSAINTAYDEEGVFISRDGKTLYFSSRGHNSMGGYDVFKSVLDTAGNWSQAENLGYPINTANDELFYSLSPNEDFALLTSSRIDDCIGDQDIYMVVPKVEINDAPAIIEIEEDVDTLSVSATEDVDMKPQEMKIAVTGNVKDTEGYAVEAKVTFENLETGKQEMVTTDLDGNYELDIEQGIYAIAVESEGYLLYSENLNSKILTVISLVKNFTLEYIEAGAKITLNNIFFETGKSELLSYSYNELDRLVALLEQYPSMNIEVAGHTDNVGDEEVNLLLSEERAEAVKAYLVEKGIDEIRLEAKGYGFSEPVASNSTDEGRRMNRRVEFRIISK